MTAKTKTAGFSRIAPLCLFALLVPTVLVGLAACGAGGGMSGGADTSFTESAVADESADGAYYAVGERAAPLASPMPSGGVSLAERIIYSAEASIETTDFDATIEKVYDLLDTYKAFIETSYVGAGNGDNRRANFTLRVPRESFADVTGDLSALGNPLSISSNAVNIQTQYTDSESRLNTYRTEEERLLAMLAEVRDVESMIAIESRLSEVRYNIESLTAQLRDWDNQVNYSSVTLHIVEFKQLRAQLQAGDSYAQELKGGFSATLLGIGAFFMEAFKLLVIALPAIVLLALVALLIFFIVKRTRARRARRAEQDEAKRDGAE
jgi:hypothetical protein